MSIWFLSILLYIFAKYAENANIGDVSSETGCNMSDAANLPDIDKYHQSQTIR